MKYFMTCLALDYNRSLSVPRAGRTASRFRDYLRRGSSSVCMECVSVVCEDLYRNII